MRTRSGRLYARSNRSFRGPARRPAPSYRQRGKMVTSGRGVTTQHDATKIYRKTRMPRYRRKRWKRFVRQVHAVAEKDMGTRSIVFNLSYSFNNADATKHGLAWTALYPSNSTTAFLNDLDFIAAAENAGNPTAAAGETVSASSKYLFQSAILDFTLTNTSYLTGALGLQTSAGKLEVDVYEIISSRQWNDEVTTYQTIKEVFDKGTSNTASIGGAATGTSLEIDDRGVTPWEVPLALSYFRLKILKKTKYFLESGGTFTYQVRDPRRHVCTQESMERMVGPNQGRMTRHIFIIFKLVPGYSVGSAEGSYTEQVTIGMTRKYMYKIEGMSEDRDLKVLQ